MNEYDKAVESYCKALEIAPADREAKYNLELALEKLQQSQQQQKQNPHNKDQQQKQQPQDSQLKQNENQQKDQKKNQPQENKDQNKSKAASELPQKSGMDPQEAKRILDAFNNQEKNEQRKQALKLQRETASGKDW
jgi:Ca-activated chloride channel family protein